MVVATWDSCTIPSDVLMHSAKHVVTRAMALCCVIVDGFLVFFHAGPAYQLKKIYTCFSPGFSEIHDQPQSAKAKASNLKNRTTHLTLSVSTTQGKARDVGLPRNTGSSGL